MKLTEFFIAQLEAEAPRTRKTLEQVPEGRPEYKPHPKSMPLGYLSQLVATIPAWISAVIKQDQLDLNPPGGQTTIDMRPLNTTAELVAAHDRNVRQALADLAATTDDHLLTTWQLLVAGNVVSEDPRRVVIRDSLMHLAHHRGQLTVYLRLNDAKVPAIYGPSADDRNFS